METLAFGHHHAVFPQDPSTRLERLPILTVNGTPNRQQNVDNRIPISFQSCLPEPVESRQDDSSITKSSTSKRSKKKRCIRSQSYHDACYRQHWWKVCWIYNGSHLLDSARRNKCIATIGRPYHHQPEQSSPSSGAFATLPRHFRSSAVGSNCSRGNKNLRSAPKPTNDNQIYTEMVSSEIDTSDRSIIMPNLQLTESKSMSTLETRNNGSNHMTPFRSFSSQLKLVDRINFPKEMARFCSQQLSSSQLLQSKITQPLAIWARSKTDCSKSNAAAVNLLIQYKGINWRKRQLEYQMPIHDAELFRQPTAESRFIRNKQRKALVKSELFVAQHANDVCQKCRQVIQCNSLMVKLALHESHLNNGHVKGNASTTQSTAFLHIDCFTCSECRQILVELKAYIHVSNDAAKTKQNANETISVNNYSLFCSRHFVEIFKPRCPYCDQLILDEECTEAEGKAWHIGHFCCSECKRSLGGQQYIMSCAEKKESPTMTASNKQLPYCLTCFDILFGELCEECGELIGCEVGAIIHDGRSWHATDVCFRCSLCLKSLLGKPFLPALDGRIYCSLTCSQAMVSHQKERLRRQKKLQTVFSQKKSEKPSPTSKIKDTTPKSTLDHSDKSSCAAVAPTTSSRSIKEQRDQFLKSMTLNRYEQKLKHKYNDYEKIKILNLTQLVNYEKFIKQSNQFFTSKYDWSKEQEFVDVIDSSNEMCGSSQTTATSSDHNSEDNNLAQHLSAKCDLGNRLSDSLLHRKSPNVALQNADLTLDDPQQMKMTAQLDDCGRGLESLNYSSSNFSVQAGNKSQIADSPSTTQSISSSQSSDMRFQLTDNQSIQHNDAPHGEANPTYFFTEKTSSLDSPSSNMTVQSWATSPPPEYSKLEVDIENEIGSNFSLCRIPPKESISKENGILKAQSNGINKNESMNSVIPNAPRNCEDFQKKKIASFPVSPGPNESIANFYYQSKSTSKDDNKNASNEHNHLQADDTALSNGGIKPGVKSVSFDPNIEDKKENERRSIRRIRSRFVEAHYEDCSDSHSCSSCSTCSSSSSDDDDDDGYELSLSTYDAHYRARPNQSNSSNCGQVNHDACTIS